MFFKNLKHKCNQLIGHLTHISKTDRLSGWSLVFVLFIDILLLSALFTGLREHSDQLTHPNRYFPTSYRELLLEKQWDIPSKQLDSLQRNVLNQVYLYTRPHARSYTMHPVCESVYRDIQTITRDKSLRNLFDRRSKALKNQRTLKKELSKLDTLYNTHLIEVAVDKKNSPNIDAVSESLKTKTERFNELEGIIKTTESSIFKHAAIQAFLKNINSLTPSEKMAITKDIQSITFWYPVKLLFYQLIFLLPLLLLAFFWSLRSMRRASYVQTLIGSHLLVIISIPIIIRLVDIITVIIPDRVFKDFLILLQKLHIIALWHYFLIFLVVIVGVYVINFTLNRAKEKAERKKAAAKAMLKHIDGNCCSCLKKLPFPMTRCCPYCGEKQLEPCAACTELTYTYVPFCHVCGTKKVRPTNSHLGVSSVDPSSTDSPSSG